MFQIHRTNFDTHDDVNLINLFLGEAARIAFYNLRTRFARKLKRKRSIKAGMSSTTDISMDGVEDEEHFTYLSWLETHIKTRRLTLNSDSKTSGNDYGNEDSDTDTPAFGQEESPSEMQGTNNLRPTKKVKLIKGKARLNHEMTNRPAEVHVLQSVGATLGRKNHDVSRHEDEIFGAFVISQLRQIPQHRKILLKMQISNMLYNEVLSTLPSSEGNVAQPLVPNPSTTPLNTLSSQSLNMESHNISLGGTSVTTVNLPPTAQAIQATIPLTHDSQTIHANSVLSQHKHE